jgi:hypothetical protein
MTLHVFRWLMAAIIPGLQRQLIWLQTELIRLESGLSDVSDDHGNSGSAVQSTNRKEFDSIIDDEELLRNFFDTIDTQHNQLVTLSQIDEFFRNETDQLGFIEALKVVLNDSGEDTELDFARFKAAAQKVPRVRGQRVSWAASIGLDAAFAKYLKVGSLSDPLKGVKEMSDQEMLAACFEFFRSDLSRMAIEARDALTHIATSLDPERTNQKFSGTGGAMVASFATLDDFQKGPEGLLGYPNPKLMEGMEIEHCLRASARRFLLTPNYDLVTRTEWEWNYSVHGGAQDVPADLQARFSKTGGRFPGEFGDVLSELEVAFHVRRDARGGTLDALNTPASLEAAVLRQLSAAHELLPDEEAQLRGIRVLRPAEANRRGDGFEMALVVPLSARLAVDSATPAEIRRLLCSAIGADPAGDVVTGVALRGRTSRFCEFVECRALVAGVVDDASVAEMERRLAACEDIPDAGECRPPLDAASAQEHAAAVERHRRALDAARGLLQALGSEDHLGGPAAQADAGGQRRQGSPPAAADAAGVRGAFARALGAAFDEQSRAWRACGRLRKQGRGRPPRIGEFVQRLRARPAVREKLDRSRLRQEEVLTLSMDIYMYRC